MTDMAEIERLRKERDDYEAEGRRHIKTIAELRHENEQLKAEKARLQKWLGEALVPNMIIHPEWDDGKS